MKQHNKLNSEHSIEQQSTQNATQEFAKVEDLLRYDAARTTTPAGVAQRLQKSSADFPKPSRPWWQRLFQR